MYEIINNVLGIFVLYVIPLISLYILYNNKKNINIKIFYILFIINIIYILFSIIYTVIVIYLYFSLYLYNKKIKK